jgi:subtilisin family serine protease
MVALLRPERLLHDPRATGEGISVCIIDSGVEESVLRERHETIHAIQGGTFVAGRKEPLPYDGRQSTPHGTTVADIILKLAPRVRLYSADVLGAQGTCEVEVVLQALRWAVHVWQCNIVNLSLGVPEERLPQLPRRFQLLRAVEEAYDRNVLVVAAAHNDHPLIRSYPAVFASTLLTVDKELLADPLQVIYRMYEGIEFQAHGRGYVGPFAHALATSWAAPHVTGVAARLLSLRPTLKPFEMKTLLYWLFLQRQGQGASQFPAR